MKVLLINGSPHVAGNTATVLEEMKRVFEAAGVQTVTLQVGKEAVRGCIGCRSCLKTGKCAFDDIVNETVPLLAECDGVVLGSPVYYAGPNGTLTAFLDRLFYSSGTTDKRMKVGASVVVARRGGLSSAMDQLNKYFSISGMPIASSQYWNDVHGMRPGEVTEDGEGMQTVRTLARNMVFLMRSIALGKEAYGLPEKETRVWTNFVR